MPNRSAIFAWALSASILAGAGLSVVTGTGAQAAGDNCLTAPREATPAGTHWYYRIERATKRQCWYLRDENDKTARSAPPPNASSSTKSAAEEPAARPAPRATTRKSVADAYAEWTSKQGRADQDAAGKVEPPAVPQVPAAGTRNSPSDAAPDTATSPIATRWPNASDASSSGTMRTADAGPPASEQATPPSAPASLPAAPIALAAADSPMAKQSASMEKLFLVMAGALALAGITASLVFRFGRAPPPRPEIRNDRRAIWDSIHAERSPRMFPGEDVPTWHHEDAYDPRAPDDPQRRVTEMLSRLTRGEQA